MKRHHEPEIRIITRCWCCGATPTTSPSVVPHRDGTIDALDFAELSKVLKSLQQDSGRSAKLDILGFDACDLATVEMACQLEPFAKYLLASQIGIPIPGWPYDRILDRLRNPYGRLMNPPEFGSYVVRRFCESYTARIAYGFVDAAQSGTRDRAPGPHGMSGATLASVIGDPGTRDRIAYLIAQSRTDAAGRTSTSPICASTWYEAAATRPSSRQQEPWEIC